MSYVLSLRSDKVLLQMIISPDILRKEMISLLTQIDTQIKEVSDKARNMGLQPEQLRDENGSWPMIQLLSAKTTVISTLAQLNESQKNSRSRPNTRKGI